MSLLNEVEVAENPSTRLACAFFLDTSGSMGGEPMAQLNEGLKLLGDHMRTDSLISKSADVFIMTFGLGGVTIVQQFISAGQFTPPVLAAGDGTPLGECVVKGVPMVKDRKAMYDANGIGSYIPLIFLITDGEPGDCTKQAESLIREGEEKRRFAFFAIGVEGANMKRLAQISVRPPMKLRGLEFKELFLWIKGSMKAVTGSRPGENVALPPLGWTATSA